MSLGEEMVTISRKRYDELVVAQQMLNHLYAMGVDNWEGYSSPGDEEEEDWDEDQEA